MKIISMFTAFLIHPFMLQSPDFTGSKSGVVINVKSAMDLSQKLVYIIIIIHKCIVLAARYAFCFTISRETCCEIDFKVSPIY